MRLSEEQSRALLAKHGVYVTEACDQCGKILGPVRFTRFGQPGEWCSRECRDGVQVAERYRATRKGGRPRKYQNGQERKAAQRQQNANRQRNYRRRLTVTQNPLVSDSFDALTEGENRPLAIPPQQESVCEVHIGPNRESNGKPQRTNSAHETMHPDFVLVCHRRGILLSADNLFRNRFQILNRASLL